MTELQKMLKPQQRQRLARIREAFKDGLEQTIETDMDVVEMLIDQNELDQAVLTWLRELPAEHLDYAAHVPADRLSAGYTAAQLQADIDALRADGLI